MWRSEDAALVVAGQHFCLSMNCLDCLIPAVGPLFSVSKADKTQTATYIIRNHSSFQSVDFVIAVILRATAAAGAYPTCRSALVAPLCCFNCNLTSATTSTARVHYFSSFSLTRCFLIFLPLALSPEMVGRNARRVTISWSLLHTMV